MTVGRRRRPVDNGRLFIERPSATVAARATRSIRIRKLLLAGNERLDERGSRRLLLGLRVGDPHTRSSAPGWPGVRSRRLPDRGSGRCRHPARQGDRRLQRRRRRGDPLARKHAQLLAHRDPRPPRERCLQRSTEGLNPCVKRGQRRSPGQPHGAPKSLYAASHQGPRAWCRSRLAQVSTLPPTGNQGLAKCRTPRRCSRLRSSRRR